MTNEQLEAVRGYMDDLTIKDIAVKIGIPYTTFYNKFRKAQQDGLLGEKKIVRKERKKPDGRKNNTGRPKKPLPEVILNRAVDVTQGDAWYRGKFIAEYEASYLFVCEDGSKVGFSKEDGFDVKYADDLLRQTTKKYGEVTAKKVIESLKPFEKKKVVAEEIEEIGELPQCVDIEVVARSAQLVGLEAYRW